MAEAGCEGVILGIESGSAKILRLMNKTARVDTYLKAIPRLEAAGIDRAETYVTNVVKHFKWKPSGKKRLHDKPKREQVKAIVKRSCSDPAPAELRAKVLRHIAAARDELRTET